MAQDLLLDPIHKQAVELKPNGFYAVNYTILGLRMTTLSDWNSRGMASVRLEARLCPVSTSSTVHNKVQATSYIQPFPG